MWTTFGIFWLGALCMVVMFSAEYIVCALAKGLALLIYRVWPSVKTWATKRYYNLKERA